MSIKPVDDTLEQKKNHASKKRCKNSCIGKAVGLGVGTTLSCGLIYSQLNNLKTIRGKKNLVEELHIDGVDLKDSFQRKVLRDANGKITLPKSGITERTQNIVNKFKRSLFSWAGLILVSSVGLGALADRSISIVNKKELIRETPEAK